MLWVPKRTVTMKWFFWAPKAYGYTDGYENTGNVCLSQSTNGYYFGVAAVPCK